MTPLNRLTLAACAAHGADQLVLASLPFAASGPGMTGALMAAQSAAWLLVSIPAGAWADRHPRPRLVRRALALTALAATLGALGAGQMPLLAAAGFAAAAGTVVFALAAATHLPTLVPAAQLPAGNARLEMARAAAALLAPPLAGAILLQAGVAGILIAAALVAGLGLLVPQAPGAAGRAAAEPRASLLDNARAGAAQVWRDPLLRPVAACAVAWNVGFFALLAGLVPFLMGRLDLDGPAVGLVLGALGAGQVAAALGAAAVARHASLRTILRAGPAVSVLAGALLLAAGPAGGMALPCLAMALLGFGPMLWLIARNTLVQLAAPPALLGRVSATMQVAVFGVRPLGALAGGAAGTLGGPEAALALATAGFALSLLAILPIQARSWPDTTARA